MVVNTNTIALVNLLSVVETDTSLILNVLENVAIKMNVHVYKELPIVTSLRYQNH